MYLLDTNVISELRKAGDGRAHPGVLAWFANVDAAETFVSAIVLMELEIGILRLERRDARQGAQLRAWMNQKVLPEFEKRTLAIDLPVAVCRARLHVPDPRQERDALIAATALVHSLTVVTGNVTDFSGTGVAVINPWD
jgi:toxin FitB